MDCTTSIISSLSSVGQIKSAARNTPTQSCFTPSRNTFKIHNSPENGRCTHRYTDCMSFEQGRGRLQAPQDGYHLTQNMHASDNSRVNSVLCCISHRSRNITSLSKQVCRITEPNGRCTAEICLHTSPEGSTYTAGLWRIAHSSGDTYHRLTEHNSAMSYVKMSYV